MMKTKAFLALSLLFLGAPAAKADPVTIIQRVTGSFFLCANEGFTLQQSGHNYQLTGLYNVPSPGYSYAFSDLVVKGNHAYGVLRITPPERKIQQFLTPPLGLSYSFTSAENIRHLTIEIEKSFAWGDVRIICTKSGR